MSRRINICVHSEANQLSWSPLLPILECLFPIKFFFARSRGAGHRSCKFVLEDERYRQGQMGAASAPSLTISDHQSSSHNGELVQISVRFVDDPIVPFPFRGRSLRTKVPANFEYLSVTAEDSVIATTEDGPIWVASGEGDGRQFRASFAPPNIPLGDNLRTVLNGDRFFEIFPLLHFIREICASAMYEGPSLRACFMIDDPNLHWPRYGFAHYAEIASNAVRENYHVSFATIPLDAWFTHKATVEIFRNHLNHLSLLIHGNDHTYKELAQTVTAAECASLLRQAIHRIEHLERASGLKVSRVMAPPHGASSEAILEEMPKHGFESATISHGSLRAYNRDKPWTRSLGYLPSELIHGCPVLPRWGLAGNTENTILLAAFLKQPIILMGHHQDLRNGLDFLAQHARFINALGAVVWSNMTDLSRANYQWRVECDTLRLRPLGLSVMLQLSKETRYLVIENPLNSEFKAWQISGLRREIIRVCPGEPIFVPEEFDATVPIKIQVDAKTGSEDFRNGHGLRAWPVCRRFLAEGRDRLRIVR
jgi:hypothetical protein